jgi:atypical dual specificity phosphatase
MRIATMLRSLGLVPDPGAWILPNRLLLRSYPRKPADLRDLATHGVNVLVNLHRTGHDQALLATFGLTEVHLPVRDFTAPTPSQIDRGIAVIDACLNHGQGVAVHCGGGLGRSGTLVACYLVHQGLDGQEAIARIRLLRPGAIETGRQAAAVDAYAHRQRFHTP